MSGVISNITYEGAVQVTASDSVNDPSGPFAGLFVGSTQAVSLVTLKNQSVTFQAVQAGTVLRIACLRVNSTGTGDATKILGLQQVPYSKSPSAP